MLAAFVRFDDTVLAYFGNEFKAHVRDGGAVVQPALRLHLQHDVFQHLFFILIQFQLLFDQRIAFDQLAGREAYGQPRPFGMVLDQMDHCVQRTVYSASVVLGAAEILSQRFFLIACNVHRMPHQLVHALIVCRGDRYDRHAEHGFHGVDVHGAAVPGQLVHHIERDDHRGLHLQQLHRQIQVAFDIRSVDDVDDRLRFVLQHEIAGHQFFAGIRRHRVDAWKIRD